VSYPFPGSSRCSHFHVPFAPCFSSPPTTGYPTPERIHFSVTATFGESHISLVCPNLCPLVSKLPVFPPLHFSSLAPCVVSSTPFIVCVLFRRHFTPREGLFGLPGSPYHTPPVRPSTPYPMMIHPQPSHCLFLFPPFTIRWDCLTTSPTHFFYDTSRLLRNPSSSPPGVQFRTGLPSPYLSPLPFIARFSFPPPQRPYFCLSPKKQIIDSRLTQRFPLALRLQTPKACDVYP